MLIFVAVAAVSPENAAPLPTVVHESVPDPFVVKACPLVPSPPGNVNVVEVVTDAGARIAK